MTTKITQFNKSTLKPLGDAIEAALKAVAAEYGVGLRVGNCSFDPNGLASYKLHATLTNENGTAISKDVVTWKSNAAMMGFPVDALGKTIKMTHGDYKIAGLRVGRNVVNVVGTKDGKSFLIDAFKFRPLIQAAV